MANAYSVQTYQQNAVSSASPLQLIVMLYDGAIRSMELGRGHMRKKDITSQNAQLQKAQRILMELMSALDMKQGGEIASNLMSLYSFVYEQLVNANTYDREECIDAALKVMSDLRSSWVELEKITGRTDEQLRNAA